MSPPEVEVEPMPRKVESEKVRVIAYLPKLFVEFVSKNHASLYGTPFLSFARASQMSSPNNTTDKSRQELIGIVERMCADWHPFLEVIRSEVPNVSASDVRRLREFAQATGFDFARVIFAVIADGYDLRAYHWRPSTLRSSRRPMAAGVIVGPWGVLKSQLPRKAAERKCETIPRLRR